MSSSMMEALDILEKEKNISKESLFEAIENSLITACRNHFGKAENVTVEIDRETCDFRIFVEKTVVETEEDVMDKMLEISLPDALHVNPNVQVGETVRVEIDSKGFGRIATQNAKNVILQKIREEERGAVYKEYADKEHNIVTGTVQRFLGRNISINLGRADALLNENEQIRGEIYRQRDRLKVYVLEVRSGNKGPRILVSRTHPDLVKRLFEQEVTEIKDGTVEIKSIAREAGSRTKIAVYSNNPNVDPVGACVGVNGSRVGLIVDELRGEKIDVICWDENPGNLIQNALSPAKIVAVFADPDEKTAKVVVPDYQLSLAIGKEGQNARLAARLTGYKIDIKSETQAKDAPGFRYEDYLEEYEEGEEYYDEEGNYIGPAYDEDGNYIGEGYDENGDPIPFASAQEPDGEAPADGDDEGGEGMPDDGGYEEAFADEAYEDGYEEAPADAYAGGEEDASADGVYAEGTDDAAAGEADDGIPG